MKVAIFGAGVAGLSAAIELVDRGYDVEIYEKRKVLGGKVSVWKDKDGDSVESGLHIVFGGYEQLQNYLDRVGAGNNYIWKDHSLIYAEPDGKQSFFKKANLPSPWAEVIGGLQADFLTMWDKISLIKGLFPALAGNEEYFRSQDHMTYSEWHRLRGASEHSLQKLWRAIALAMNFIEPNVISARPMITIFKYFGTDYHATKFAFFRQNPGDSMIEPMRQYIQAKGGRIFIDAKLSRFELDENSTIKKAILTDGHEVTADAYISAMPVHNLKKILPKEWLHHDYFTNIFQFTGSPVANCQLWFDKKITDTDNLMFSQGTIFATFADVSLTCPEDFQEGMGSAAGGSVMSLVLAPAHQLMDMPNEAIIDLVMKDIHDRFPKSRHAKLLKSTLVKIPESVYKAVPDVDKFRPDQVSPIDNFYLAGDYTYQRYLASMEGAALSGKQVAEKLHARMAK
ncbi:MAG: FAD-dependent oxidoreductase [Prosthecochloris sp.]|uniref:Carotene 7,8-desaturase n=1 Tax=Prosthecochloris aestuarii (strain DSM 271 / SK 413) TaxID=290512 RepID=B4S907_PROA2|nr:MULTISPECIES: FAD-dependent oxidoreductase [Prosthecochloris]ACF46544.1 Carotene 7,8-desaturase [Prosthecochloris aestuarii DSM 271]MCW8798277.1 FAD-dependent oxidoreductase [Prosthecochloris sp.]NEX12655.1 FAD-binding protein [Prosthecochloris sp.]RDD29948.1 zeta-carotene desaturase [Prosthecochloris sp. ZM]